MVENSGLEAGDRKFKPGDAVPFDHDGSGPKGAPVTIDGDMQVTAAAADEFVIGQYADAPSEHANRKITVYLGKLVLVGLAGGSVAAGDMLAPDGDGGYLADNDDSTTSPTAPNYAPYALESASEGELFLVAYI